MGSVANLTAEKHRTFAIETNSTLCTPHDVPTSKTNHKKRWGSKLKHVESPQIADSTCTPVGTIVDKIRINVPTHNPNPSKSKLSHMASAMH